MRAVFFILALVALPARAADYTHSVQNGETLETLARAYYGSSWKSVYLATKNGITSVVAGKRIVVPACSLYKVRKGDSVALIAKRTLGSTDHYKLLMQENGVRDASDLAVGQELLVPFVLRHSVEPGEGLSQIARRFYRNTRRTQLLRDFNGLKADALNPGDKILVPIFDRATLDPKSRKPTLEVVATTAPELDEPAPSDVHATPAPVRAAEPLAPEAAPTTPASKEARASLRGALDAYGRGEYETACKALEGLLTEPGFNTTERALVVSYLGFCAVAAGDEGAARDYFVKWLEIVPAASLDPINTSPKILAVFQEVAGFGRSAKLSEQEQEKR